MTAGTRLQDCRLPLRQVLLAARHAMARPQGLSAKELQGKLEMTRYAPALLLLDRFRRAMAWTDGEQLLGKIAVTTQQIPAAGAGAGGATVLAAMVDSRCSGPHMLLRHVPYPLPDSFFFVFTQYIDRRSLIKSLPGEQFAWLARRDSGFRYEAIAGGRSELLRKCIATAKALGEWLKTVQRGAVRVGKLQAYCDEFAFRYEHSDSPEAAYNELLRRLVRGPKMSSKWVV